MYLHIERYIWITPFLFDGKSPALDNKQQLGGLWALPLPSPTMDTTCCNSSSCFRPGTMRCSLCLWDGLLRLDRGKVMMVMTVRMLQVVFVNHFVHHQYWCQTAVSHWFRCSWLMINTSDDNFLLTIVRWLLVNNIHSWLVDGKWAQPHLMLFFGRLMIANDDD